MCYITMLGTLRIHDHLFYISLTSIITTSIMQQTMGHYHNDPSFMLNIGRLTREPTPQEMQQFLKD